MSISKAILQSNSTASSLVSNAAGVSSSHFSSCCSARAGISHHHHLRVPGSSSLVARWSVRGRGPGDDLSQQHAQRL